MVLVFVDIFSVFKNDIVLYKVRCNYVVKYILYIYLFDIFYMFIYIRLEIGYCDFRFCYKMKEKFFIF